MMQQRQRARYFDATGRECSPTEALRAGVLRDGFSLRTSLRDSSHGARSFWDAHRDELLVVDARRIGGSEGNKPGYRVFDDDRGRQDIADARAAYIFDLENAWRTPPRDAAFGSLDAKGKEDPLPVTGRSRCPECDGRGVVHGKYCQGCGGDGWVDDDDDEADDDMPQGELEQMTSATDRRTIDQMSRDHSVAMQRIYDARNREISEAWREGKATND
jgi:hypothetical protein